MNFARFQRTLILLNISGRLLLSIIIQTEQLLSTNMIKTSGMSIFICLILCKSIAHSIPTYTTPILENSVSHINVRRSSKPSSCYSNSSATLRLILSGKIEFDPERNNVYTSNRTWKQSKPISQTTQVCN